MDNVNYSACGTTTRPFISSEEEIFARREIILIERFVAIKKSHNLVNR